MGGLRITSSGGIGCSLGFNTLVNGQYYFVTAAHCSSGVNGYGSCCADYYQPTASSIYHIGREVFNPPLFTGGLCPYGRRCRHSDATLVQYDSPEPIGRIARTGYFDSRGWRDGYFRESGSTTIRDDSPYQEIVETVDYPLANTALDKVGATTGWTGWGASSTCADLNIYQTDITMLCQYSVDAGADEGDSGSPVFYWIFCLDSPSCTQGGARLYGVEWSATRDPVTGNPVPPFWYSAYGDIRLELQSYGTLNPLYAPPPPPPSLSVSISGPTRVQPDVYCNWSSAVSGGSPPYNYSWTQGGTIVGNGASVSLYTGSASFSLGLTVTDANQAQGSATMSVSVTSSARVCPM